MPISGSNYTLPTNSFAQPVNGQRFDATAGAETLNDIATALDALVDGSGQADGSMTAAKLASNAVTEAKILDGAVTAGKIASNAVTEAKIADGAVSSGKLAANAVATAKIADGAVTEAKIGTAAVAALQIGAAAVTETKIADGAVTAGKLASNAVTEAKITDGSVTVGKLASNAVSSAKIVDGAVTEAKIGTAAVTAFKIATDAVTTARIADGNITTAKLANSSVTSAKIADSNVLTTKIADGNVTTAKLDNNAVTTAKITDANVTNAKLASMATRTVKANTTGSTAAPTDASIATLLLGGVSQTGNLVTRGQISDVLWASLIGDYDAGERGPLFIWSNPSPSDIAAGESSGMQIWIGDNPTSTPGAGDTVGVTVAVINGNSRERLYGENIIFGVASSGGGYNDCKAVGMEINGYSDYAISQTSPWGSGNRKNMLELIAQGDNQITTGLMLWATGSDGTNWYHQGLGISRVSDVGILFKKDPNGTTDTGTAFSVAAIHDDSSSSSVLMVSNTHDTIINLANATFTSAVLMPSGGASTFGLKNDANHPLYIAIDPGTSASQIGSIVFKDRGANKWQLMRESGNDFSVFNETTAANALSIAAATSNLTVAGSVLAGGSTNPLSLTGVIGIKASSGTAGFDARVGSSGLFISTDGSTYGQVMTAGALNFIVGTNGSAHTTFRHSGGLGIPVIAGDPASPTNGDVWYNSSTNKLRVRAGGSNVDLH